LLILWFIHLIFFFQAEDGIRDFHVTGVQTCALPISHAARKCRADSARMAGRAFLHAEHARSAIEIPEDNAKFSRIAFTVVPALVGGAARSHGGAPPFLLCPTPAPLEALQVVVVPRCRRGAVDLVF